MFSSFFPWEFKNNFPTLLKEGVFGPYALSCYDPFLEKIFLNSIPSHFLEDGKWVVLNPDEVTVDWLEDNLNSFDFFSSSQSYKVLMSENLSPTVQEYLLEKDLDWGNRYFLMSFQKENKFFDKLKKKAEVQSYKIKSPNFWDYDKLMKFLCEQMSIPLSFQVQRFLVETIPSEAAEYVHVLKQIALLGIPLKQVTVEHVKKEIHDHKFDNFLLARLWGSKRHEEFFKRLLPFSHDQVEMIKFFSFLQSHILKMCDLSYIEAKKTKPSKYDKEIEVHSKMWTGAELRDELRFFGQCEILAKQKSKELTQNLRLRLIDAYQS